MDRSTHGGIRSAVAAFVIWGLLTIYWKQLDDIDAFELIGWRVAMMTIVMGLVVTAGTVTAGRRRRWAPEDSWSPVIAALGNPRRLAAVAVAGILLSVNWTSYVYAVVNDQVVETALGYFLAPLGTMAIGVVLLGERLDALRRLAAGLAIVAVVVLTVSYGRIPYLALLIAITFSLYGLAKRNSPLSAVTGLTAEGLVLLAPALGIIVWGLTRPGAQLGDAAPVQWALLAGTGLATAVPLLLFSHAARTVPFTVLGPLNYLVPLINFTLGWAVFGEPMPAARLIGFVLIWLALVAITADTLRRAPAEPEPVAAG